MEKYIYKCTECGTSFSAEEIESGFKYLCSKCGIAEKNKPLKGVLKIEYNYNSLKSEYTKDDFKSFSAGKFWLYPKLWPIDFSKINEDLLQRLTLPTDTLVEYKVENSSFSILDETRNPTLSYKDRASALVALKAIEMGIDEIAAASTGNAGSSLAGICARLGLKSYIYVPQNIPDAKRIQIEAYGANLVVVEGDYDYAFDKCLDDSIKNKWYNRNTAYNPLTIEGKKSSAYDIFIQSKGNIPDIIFVPVGDGVIISSIYKGFEELYKLGMIDRIPKLIGVQSSKSDAVVRYLQNGVFDYQQANTIADSISAGAPRNLYLAAEAIKASNGEAISIDDSDILISQKEFIKLTGVLCEPSSAATYAAYKEFIKGNEVNNQSVLLLITGNGLKDIESLKG